METAEDEEVGGPLAPTDVVDILVDKDEGSPSTTSAVPLLVKSPSSPTAVGRRKGSSGIRKPNYDAIKCPCGDEEDDGFTIQCEGCLAWQHARCVSIQRHAVPERYFCAKCRQSVHLLIYFLFIKFYLIEGCKETLGTAITKGTPYTG